MSIVRIYRLMARQCLSFDYCNNPRVHTPGVLMRGEPPHQKTTRQRKVRSWALPCLGWLHGQLVISPDQWETRPHHTVVQASEAPFQDRGTPIG